MRDHAKPSQRYNPDEIILHTGNNDLPTPKTAEVISDNIITPSEINPEDPSLILNNLIIKNIERIIVWHLNINHINNTFETLISLVKDRLDVILFSETKIDSSFPPSQFVIEDYSNPFKRDRDVHGGGYCFM